MNSRHNSDQQKFKDAGEQAAKVFGEFISIADEFSRRLEGGISDVCKATTAGKRAEGGYQQSYARTDGQNHSSWQNQSDRQHQRYSQDRPAEQNDYADENRFASDNRSANDAIDDHRWQMAGEYLREMREAAGYTIEGFAKAMNRNKAAEKIISVEAGYETFPKDWLDQISSLLQQQDPLAFFEKLRSLYDLDEQRTAATSTAEYDTAANTVSPTASVASVRRQRLAGIFTDESLENLSDSEFEELAGFIETNYQAAIQLVTRK